MARGAYAGRGLHGAVVQQLGRRIVAGRVAADGSLPSEPELAAEAGASRTVVREALKVLAAKGLVRTRPMTGIRVLPRSEWHMLDPDVLSWRVEAEGEAGLLRELLEVRRIVEPAVARLAAERIGRASLAELEAAWSRMQAALAEPTAFVDADLEFHGAVLTAAGNELLAQLFGVIGAALRLGRVVQVRVHGNVRPLPPDPLAAHGRVLAAIRVRDPTAAETAMREVVESAARDAERVLARAARHNRRGAAGQRA